MRRTLVRLGLAVAAMSLALAGATPAAQGIVNGSNVTVDPGVVSFWTDSPNRNRCTGALVDDEQGGPGTRWVATAAHCVYAFTATGAGNVTARLGSTNNTTGYTAIQVVPGQFWYNPGFDPNTLAYDVMLVKLVAETPPNVPVMKWRKPSLPVGAVAQAYGYGWVCDGPAGLPCSTWYTGPMQKMLAERKPDSACSATITVSLVCFADAQGGYTMACPGDSGGPIKSPDLNGTPILRWVIVGEGDSNFDKCTEGPNGEPGLGVALDVGQPNIQSWMDDVMNIGDTLATASAAPAPSARALALIN